MNCSLNQKEKDRPVRQTLCGVLRRSSNLKCLILTFLIHGCLVAIIWCRNTQVTKILLDFDAFPITRTRQVSPCDDGVVYIPTAFVIMLYLLYLVECWHSRARIQLSLPKTDISTVYRKIQEMREAQPIVWWKAICYHYVRRVRQVTRYRNGGSYTSSQVFYERVNSHAVASYFFYTLCGMRDVSRDIIDLEKYPATKIKFTKGFIFANLPTAAEFEEQRSTFFQEQGRLDDYMEMREALELSNTTFKESLIAWARPECLPWFAKTNIFWISSFLLLSWPIRILLELNTAHLNYRVTKLFGINYPSNSSFLHQHRPLLYSNYLTQGGHHQDTSRPRRPMPVTSPQTAASTQPNRMSLTRPTATNGIPPNLTNCSHKNSSSSLDKRMDGDEGWGQRCKGQNGRRRPIIPRSVTLMVLDPLGKGRGSFKNCTNKQIMLNFDHSRDDDGGLIPTYSEALLMENTPRPTLPNPAGSPGQPEERTHSDWIGQDQSSLGNSDRSSSGAQGDGESNLGENDFGDGESETHLDSRPPTFESPPTYLEALRTSRPVFLPRFTGLRRCLTERNLTGGGGGGGEHERIQSWLNTTSSYFLQRFGRIRLSGSDNNSSRAGSRNRDLGSPSSSSSSSTSKNGESHV